VSDQFLVSAEHFRIEGLAQPALVVDCHAKPDFLDKDGEERFANT
jgi:hypothetical protein